MIFIFFKNFFKMILSPRRLPGRSWTTELILRVTREFFAKGNTDPQWFRKQVDKGLGPHPAFSKVSSNMRSIADVPCMMLSPISEGELSNVVLYLHGGGYVLGSANGHKSILAPLAIESDSLVIAPDYRLAPEHVFPAPHEDSLKVALAIIKTYSDKKIVIAGDSAGGALAIATTLELIKLGHEDRVAKLVLLSPWVDPAATGGSMSSNQKHDYLKPAFLNGSLAALMPDRDMRNPKINFTQGDYSKLPKTLVQFAGGEIFHDQINDFNQRLESQKVDVTVNCYKSQFHVFQLFSAILKDAKVAMAEIGDFIRS